MRHRLPRSPFAAVGLALAALAFDAGAVLPAEPVPNVLTLDPDHLTSEAEVHRNGYRASDKGFLALSWDDYLKLLRWTARQGLDAIGAKVPQGIAKRLAPIGIDASLWADLVWNWQKYFGNSSCVGRSDSMKADAEARGIAHHRGQKIAATCFA